MQLELTTNQPGRRRLAQAALITAALAATLGLGAAGIAGAQDTEPPATQAATTVADTQAPADETVPPDAIADDGNSAPTPDDAAQSDEKLLNLIIIGLLVLAAVIAVATLVFWKSTAPEADEDASDADPDDAGDDDVGDDAGFEDAEYDDERELADAPTSSPAPVVAVRAPRAAPLPDPQQPPAASDPSAGGRRVMASFPSSPLGEPGHPVSGSVPATPKDPPPAPLDEAGEDVSTLGSGASPGRPQVPPPDAVVSTPQRAGAYQVPPPDDLPPQPDRPFADAENRPRVERAETRAPAKARRVPAPPQPVGDSAIVSTSAPKQKPATAGQGDEEGPPVVVRRRRRDRPAGPWGEGVGGGHRPEVPPLPPPDPQDQGYQRGVRVVRPDEPAGEDSGSDQPEQG